MTTILHCWWQIIVAAFVYFALGAAWFNPKTFGNAWMKSHGIVRDEEKMKDTNMGMMFGLYLEFSSPGLGLGGSLAATSLFLIILSSFALEIGNWLELILLFAVPREPISAG